MRVTILLSVVALPLLTALFFVTGDNWTLDLAGNLSLTAALILAILNFVRATNAAPHRSVQRKAWARISFGLFAWLLGEILILYSEIVIHQTAYGTVADPLLVLGYFPIFSGLFVLARDTQRQRANSSPAIVGHFLWIAALYLLLFSALLWRLPADARRSIEWRFLDVAYPTLDLLGAGLGAYLYRLSRIAPELRALRFSVLLCSAFLLLTASDILFAHHLDFSSLAYRLIDVPYSAAYFLVAIAGAAAIEVSPQKR